MKAQFEPAVPKPAARASSPKPPEMDLATLFQRAEALAARYPLGSFPSLSADIQAQKDRNILRVAVARPVREPTRDEVAHSEEALRAITDFLVEVGPANATVVDYELGELCWDHAMVVLRGQGIQARLISRETRVELELEPKGSHPLNAFAGEMARLGIRVQYSPFSLAQQSAAGALRKSISPFYGSAVALFISHRSVLTGEVDATSAHERGHALNVFRSLVLGQLPVLSGTFTVDEQAHVPRFTGYPTMSADEPQAYLLGGRAHLEEARALLARQEFEELGRALGELQQSASWGLRTAARTLVLANRLHGQLSSADAQVEERGTGDARSVSVTFRASQGTPAKFEVPLPSRKLSIPLLGPVLRLTVSRDARIASPEALEAYLADMAVAAAGYLAIHRTTLRFVEGFREAIRRSPPIGPDEAAASLAALAQVMERFEEPSTDLLSEAPGRFRQLFEAVDVAYQDELRALLERR